MGGNAYRCDVCRDTRDRCAECRARRAAANAERRDARRAAGRCIMCGAPALVGYARCTRHLEDNRVRSAAAHIAARRAASE